MTTAEPPDDDILAAMEAQLADIEDPDVVDVTALTGVQLMVRRNDLTNKLTRLGEMPFPRTPQGRDLHSELAAATRELKLRRML